jgi:hypothetical protein
MHISPITSFDMCRFIILIQHLKCIHNRFSRTGDRPTTGIFSTQEDTNISNVPFIVSLITALVTGHWNLIFVVPCIILNSEINPTRCNNCVYSSQWFYSTCFGHSEKQHGITRQWSPTTQHDRQR